MGTAATVANVPEILKYIWKDGIAEFMYADSAYFGRVAKDTSWDGLFQIVTVRYANMPGRSALFSVAQDAKGPAKYKKMQIPSKDNFAVWSVDHKLITLARNQRGALVRALAENTEQAMEKFKRSVCWMLWRNGGGAVGKIAAGGITGNVITLADINDIRNFDLGDVLDAATTDGTSGAVKVNATPVVVTALNEDAGTITVSTTPLTLTVPWAAADFIFHKGDFGAALSGIPAYIPLATPGTGGVPASIHGMDRTDFPTRLAGNRYAATTANVNDELRIALLKSFRRNSKITDVFVGPELYNEIDATLSTSRRYVDVKVGTVGYQGLEFTAQTGKVVKIFSDADIPKSANNKRLAYGLNLDSWKLHSALDYPGWLSIDGKKSFMQEQNANQSEGRVGGYAEHYTDSPGDNFVLEMTT